MHHPTLYAVGVAVLSVLPGAQASLYSKKSPVLQVDAKSYDSLIAKSNYTSIVEFYAPWCGHCKNLQPAYEKVAKNLEGLAKVAAVNCDDDANKQFCGSMGVQGFPTLKIVKPRKGGGKPMVEDYQGPRTAAEIVDNVVRRINNHVQKIEDKNIDDFLNTNNQTAKAILFTDKGTTSALLKSIAIDFLDVITIGQVRNKEAKSIELFGVDKFPTLVLLPGGDANGIVYDGEIKKAEMVKFLSQVGEPNPDPAPKKSVKKEKAPSSSSSAKSKATPSTSSTDDARTETKTESASDAPTQEKPDIPDAPLPLREIGTREELITECLNDRSHTCLLAFVSSEQGPNAKEALASLETLAWKDLTGKRVPFPFFRIAKENEGAVDLLKALDLSGEVEIVAINARRGWWRHYEGGGFDSESIAVWIDAIRLGDGVKKKLPEGIVAISVEPASTAAQKPEGSTSETTSAQATESAPEPKTESEQKRVHEEL